MYKFKIILVLGAISVLNACDSNLDGVMSQEDIIALQQMEIAYDIAFQYNDSLAIYRETTGIDNDMTYLYYDDMFHYHDSIFDSNHTRYSHLNNGDEHNANLWMMGSGILSGYQMGTNYNSNYCTNNNLDLMESLMIDHVNYHPGD